MHAPHSKKKKKKKKKTSISAISNPPLYSILIYHISVENPRYNHEKVWYHILIWHYRTLAHYAWRVVFCNVLLFGQLVLASKSRLETAGHSYSNRSPDMLSKIFGWEKKDIAQWHREYMWVFFKDRIKTSTAPSCSGPIPAQKLRTNSVPRVVFSYLMPKIFIISIVLVRENTLKQ